ncbi:MAG: response regulator transcription factor [Actinomycetota bacterium]
MNTGAVSVVLVDDHTMLRQGLRRSLETEGITVVAEASNGDEAVRVALATKPSVVLMDVSMPEVDGIEATRQLLRADARQRVVMLTMHVDRTVIERAMKAGAVGYITKDSSVKEVALAVRMAANGDRIMSPRLAGVMADRPPTDDASRLSPREEELLQYVADGLSTTDVADRMCISPKTVKNHLASIYDKLDARDKTQAVLTAVRLGIVTLA